MLKDVTDPFFPPRHTCTPFRFELTANYVLSHATTWGATAGELFDYVNGVSNVLNPFGPGDNGPSGEDVHHRFVLVGVLQLPWNFEASTISQFESARPFTMTTPAVINGDGVANDRAVINGVQTSLDHRNLLCRSNSSGDLQPSSECSGCCL